MTKKNKTTTSKPPKSTKSKIQVPKNLEKEALALDHDGPHISHPDQLVLALTRWYNHHRRDLPWRNTKDPYAIWVSEIMLQQTQVNTVIPYYERFLTQFPTVEDLANAPLDQVLKAWEGLGYYGRCRNMHKAAQMIRDEYQCQFPSTLEAIQALPGIGQSTAGAIATFAFATPSPILDGNVKRVLARLMGLQTPLQDTTTIKQLWSLSHQLVPHDPQVAYDLNQGLMELGATLCSLKKPTCNQCPWQSACVAYETGQQDTLPLSTPKKPTPHYDIGVGVVWKGDQVMITLRPAEGLLGGLWEFPGGKCEPGESTKDCVVRELKEETDITVSVGSKLLEVKHAYTHFKVTLHVYECFYTHGTAKPLVAQDLKWVTLEELSQFAFPKANNHIIDFLKTQPARQLTLC